MLCILALVSSLVSEDFTCPASLSVQQTAAKVPSGWEAIPSSEPAHLDRIAFYLHNPKIGGALVPDKTSDQKGEARDTWNFIANPGDDFWLGCVYTGSSLVLAQKLKAGISQCVVRYDLLPSGSRLRVKSISCK
jgi:hypothetical protein